MGEQSRSLGVYSESRRAAASARGCAAGQKSRRPSQRRSSRIQLVASSSWLRRRSPSPQARSPRKSERPGPRRQWRRRTDPPLMSGVISIAPAHEALGTIRSDSCRHWTLITRRATRGSSEARSSARCRGERQPSEEEGDGPSLSVLQYQKAIGDRTCTIERPRVAQGWTVFEIPSIRSVFRLPSPHGVRRRSPPTTLPGFVDQELAATASNASSKPAMDAF